MGPRASLVIRHENKQTTFEVITSRVTIGRSIDASLRIPSTAISREHCLIESFNDGYRIRDLNSKNGTYVNGAKLAEKQLDPGDIIQLGDVEIIFTTDALKAEETDAKLEVVDVQIDDTQTVSVRFNDVDLKSEKLSAQYLALMYDISTRVMSARDPDRACADLLELLLSHMKVSRAAVVIYPDRRCVRVTRGKGIDKRVTLDAKFSKKARETGQGFLNVTDISRLFAPVVSHDIVIGILYLDTAGTTTRLNNDDLSISIAIGRQLGLVLENIRYTQTLEKEKHALTQLVIEEGKLVGQSQAMREALEMVRKISATDSPVIILGESGSGKELVARAIHFNSNRKERAFVAINCGAIPKELVESELFGYEKGAFTGATNPKAGLFEAAHHGTLFLDEIAELPADAQVKLLRALEQRKIRRVGATIDTSVDARVVCATNRDLKNQVKTGAFREDLYYRLNVIEVRVPPLRERREDIPLLVNHFVATLARRLGKPVAGVDETAMHALTMYGWPGNVRELRNALERAILLSVDQVLRLEDFPLVGHKEALRQAASTLLAGTSPLTLDKLEREYIVRVLAGVGGNKAEASRILGISRFALYDKLKRYGLGSESEALEAPQ